MSSSVLLNRDLIRNCVAWCVHFNQRASAAGFAAITRDPTACDWHCLPTLGNMQAAAFCSGCTSCGLLTAATGAFSDGSGNLNVYPNYANCVWIIAPTGATQVTVTFSRLSIQAGHDFVVVQQCPDVSCSTRLVELARLTGNPAILEYTSMTGYMAVRFTSDGQSGLSGLYPGVIASWIMVGFVSHNQSMNGRVMQLITNA